jgi:phosphate-selective porin OprO/OprP
MDSADKQFALKIGGRIQNDWAAFDADKDVETAFGNAFQTGTEFRRARLYMAGTMYGNIGFKAQYDFAGSSTWFKDVYMTLDQPCIGTFTVGHHYEPFGFETNTSDLNTIMMERSTPDSLAPERNTGISLKDHFNDNWMWHVGYFRNSDGFGDDSGNIGASEYALTARIAGVAWEDADADQLLHFGGSISRRKLDEAVINPIAGLTDEVGAVASRGASHLGPRLANTGTFVVDDNVSTWWGIDAGFKSGPIWLQAEYANQNYDTAVGGNSNVDAWSIMGSYFLTGEARSYEKGSMNLGRVMPKGNYGDGDSWGAWELAARYDTIDMNDGGLAGGEFDQWTLGVNWYLNPNTKVMLNYAMVDIAHVGDLDVIEARFQVDF